MHELPKIAYPQSNYSFKTGCSSSLLLPVPAVCIASYRGRRASSILDTMSTHVARVAVTCRCVDRHLVAFLPVA